jgi:hypothetical protein
MQKEPQPETTLAKFDKDINLLSKKIRQNPQAHKDKLETKISEFETISLKVKAQPSHRNEEFTQLVHFFAQIYDLFPKRMEFLVEVLQELLQSLSDQLNHTIRFKIVQTLLIIQKKGHMAFIASLPFFLRLLGLEDKSVRKLIFNSLFFSIKLKQKSKKIDFSALSAFLQRFLSTCEKPVRKRILKLLIKLYDKSIWRDRKIVNMVAEQVDSGDASCAFIVVKWLISSTEVFEEIEDSDEEGETLEEVTRKMGKQYKSSKKKIEKLTKQIRNLKRKKRRAARVTNIAHTFPLDLLYSPTKFLERLIRLMNRQKHLKFLLKLRILCLCGRIINRHRLIYPAYYNLVIKYMKPQTQNILHLLAFIAESIHDRTPIGDLETISKQLLNNFISEAFNENILSAGINTAREIYLRNQCFFTTEEINYVCSLRSYKDKSVNSSVKSFINAVRDTNPDVLNKEYQLSFGMKSQNQLEKALWKPTNKGAIDGVELLGEGNNVDNDRILTEDDFKTIKRLKREKIMELVRMEHSKIHLDSDNRDETRDYFLTNELAVVKSTTDILGLKKKFDLYKSGKLEVEDIENDEGLQKLIYGEVIKADEDVGEEIEEELSEISEYSVRSEDEDELEFEENEEGEPIEEEDKDTKIMAREPLLEESDSESEPNYAEDEEAEMKRRGFVTMSRIDTYKRRRRIHNRLELKGADHYESIMAKKFGNRKKAKMGSRTNQEKQKNKPMLMLVNKMNQMKGVIKQTTKRIKKKDFKGRIGRFGFKNKKQKKRF